MLTTLLLALLPQTAATVTEIQARVPRTPLVVSLDLSEWKENRELAEGLAGKALIAGSIAPGASNLSVIAEPNEPLASPQSWRQRLGPAGAQFDVEFTPCVDASQELAPGMFQSDFHAFYATRTQVFHVHVSRFTDDDQRFPREEFERIVRSLRVRLLRRGWSEDYPPSIGVPMTLAAVLGVDQKPWKDSWLPRHAEEWQANFANAEFLRWRKAPAEQQLAAYDKALALISKLEKPDAKTRFALAILHDGRSLALYDAKRLEETLAPIETSLAILTELGRLERAGLAYNLACSHALLEHTEPALAALKLAIEVDPHYRESATKDADFAALASNPEFKRLLAPPAPATPEKRR